MPKTDKIDALISTVRELNHQVRPKLTEEIGGGSGNLGEVHGILGEMRNQELVYSHGIKRMILTNREGVDVAGVQNMMGTASGRISLEEVLAIHEDADKLPTRVVMSEFASAREAILSLLRELPDQEWEIRSELAIDEGRETVDAVVDHLIASDIESMRKINQLMGVAA